MKEKVIKKRNNIFMLMTPLCMLPEWNSIKIDFVLLYHEFCRWEGRNPGLKCEERIKKGRIVWTTPPFDENK